MPHAPHYDIFRIAPDGSHELLERLFTPDEFFEFATILSFVRDDFPIQPDPDIKAISDGFDELLATLRGQLGDELEELFAWYCQQTAQIGKWAAAFSGTSAKWQATPADFDPDIRLFLMYAFQHYPLLESGNHVDMLAVLFQIFSLLIDANASNFQYRETPDFKPAGKVPYLDRANVRMSQHAKQKLDRLREYCTRAQQNADRFSFSPIPLDA